MVFLRVDAADFTASVVNVVVSGNVCAPASA